MKDFKRCDICAEWHCTDEPCDPEYLVYHEESMGDEAKSVRASDHEEAAIKYGQWYNQDDYELINETIQVKVVKDGEIKYFQVSAEPDIHYSSKEIDKLDNNKS